MQSFFHKLLFFLDPETAHHLAISFLKKWPVKKKERHPAITIKNVPSLAFENRIGLAAGFDKSAEVFPALSSFGFGFIEVGTVTPEPQEGNPKPRIWRTSHQTLVNKLGFNNCGLKQFKENILQGREKTTIPLFANIGKNKVTPNEKALEDYRKGFLALKDYVDAFVVNISSPNTPGLRELQSAEFLTELSKILPKEKPVFVKFSADLALGDLKQLLDCVRAHPFAGVVLVNTSAELAKTKMGKQEGGLSGTYLIERALERVSLAKEILKEEKTIIGVGGVSSVYDFTRMRKAGADLVEIYTSFIYQGPELVRALSKLD